MLTQIEIEALIQLLSRTPLSIAEKLFLDQILQRLQLAIVGAPVVEPRSE